MRLLQLRLCSCAQVTCMMAQGFLFIFEAMETALVPHVAKRQLGAVLTQFPIQFQFQLHFKRRQVLDQESSVHLSNVV